MINYYQLNPISRIFIRKYSNFRGLFRESFGSTLHRSGTPLYRPQKDRSDWVQLPPLPTPNSSSLTLSLTHPSRFWGGKCHLVDPPKTIYEESHRLAKELKGHYMDQFTYAERATDWRGYNFFLFIFILISLLFFILIVFIFLIKYR